MPQRHPRRRIWPARLAILALALAMIAPVAAGIPGGVRAQERIVGGDPAKPGTFPFVAALWTDDLPGVPWCMGTLIAPGTVLTAASCTYPLSVQDSKAQWNLTVSFEGPDGGSISKKQRWKVREIIRYPGFGPQSCAGALVACRDDAAILLLASAPKGIAPVALVSSGDRSRERVGGRLTLAGWSSEFVNAPFSPRLKHGTVNVVRQSLCAKRYDMLNSTLGLVPPVNLDAASNFCTYRTDVGPCYEEFGGPALAKTRGGWLQVGITTTLQGCAQAKWPTIHTRISNPDIHAWIVKTAGLPGGRSGGQAGGGE